MLLDYLEHCDRLAIGNVIAAHPAKIGYRQKQNTNRTITAEMSH